MNRIFFLVIFLLVQIPFFSFGQTIEANRVKERMTAYDVDFAVTEIDPKYKDRSAVIICQKIEYGFKREVFFTSIFENYAIRERVKLLDKAAVEQFSQMEYDVSSQLISTMGHRDHYYYIGIKIIKPDLSEIEVGKENFVIEEIKRGYSKIKIQKIAIPGLNIGDIIEYYYVRKNTLISTPFYEFDPNYFTFSNSYPIMKQKTRFYGFGNCYTNVKSLNVTPVSTIYDKKDDDSYCLTFENIDRSQPERWIFPFREYPLIKFQSFYFPKKVKKVFPMRYKFIKRESIYRESFTKKEIQEMLDDITSRWYYSQDQYLETSKLLRKCMTFLKSNFKKEQNPEIILTETNSYLRQLINRSNFVKNDLYNENTDNNKELRSDVEYNNNFISVSVLSGVLKAKKIPHEVFITIPNYIGTIDDFLFPSEMVLGIRIKGEKELYASSINKFSVCGELPSYLLGNKAYSVDVLQAVSKRVLNEFVLPEQKPEDTFQKTDCLVKFDPDNMDSLFVERTVEYSGDERFYYQNNLILPNEYINECKDEKYGFRSLEDETFSKNKKQLVNERLQQKNQQDISDRLDRLKTILINEFDVKDISIKDFSVIQLGMWNESPTFKFKDSFVIPEFISKAGENCIVNVGKLIGGQVQLLDNEIKERHADISMSTARQFKATIQVVIPNGYRPIGVEDLNVQVMNETGGFISKAEYRDGTLKIETSKVYKQAHLPKEKWNLMIDFLKAASDFTQKKILLQKV